MSFYNLKNAEDKTQKFFRNKYGFFWKRKMNPKRLSWIGVDEYYNKFREFSGLPQKTNSEDLE